MKVNEILVQIRENNFKSQEQTAEMLNIAQSTYAEYESGAIIPPINKLCDFAVRYKTRLDYVLGISKNKMPLGKMKNFNNNIFSSNLKILRKENRLTQKDLGIKLSCSDTAISKYENANSLMPFDTLIKLSKIYNISTDYITGIVNYKF